MGRRVPSIHHGAPRHHRSETQLFGMNLLQKLCEQLPHRIQLDGGPRNVANTQGSLLPIQLEGNMLRETIRGTVVEQNINMVAPAGSAAAADAYTLRTLES